MDLGEIPRLDGVRERRTEVRNVVHVEGGSGPQPSDHRPPVDPEIAQIDAAGTRRDSFGRIPSSAFEPEQPVPIYVVPSRSFVEDVRGDEPGLAKTLRVEAVD